MKSLQESRTGGHSVSHALNAILEADLTEIDEQSQTAIAQPEMGQQLLRVNRCELLHRLELHNKAPLDQQVGAETFLEGEVAILDGYWDLPFRPQAKPAEFMGQDCLVNRFEEARSSLCMDGERRIQDKWKAGFRP